MNALSATLVLLFVQALEVVAHPLNIGLTQSHASLRQRSTIDLDRFRLKSHAVYVKADDIEQQSINSFSTDGVNYVEAATNLLTSVVPQASYRLVGDHYVDTNGVGHVRFKQTAHEFDIDNADFNVNIAKDGSVLSYGHSFFEGPIPATSPSKHRRDLPDPLEALKGANEVLELAINADRASAEQQDRESYIIKGTSGVAQDPKVELIYFRTDEELKLTWRVETNLIEHWLLTYVDAQETSRPYGVVDWVAAATYNVYPWGVNDPSEGSRTIISTPWDVIASEFGWHSSGTTTFTTTQGNNAIAHTAFNGALGGAPPEPPVEGASGLAFDFTYDASETNSKAYSNASVTQLFYTSNIFHDVLYKLGFTEAAGNFESNNNGQGGMGGDAVVLNSQDGTITNNAFFGTPPDGQSGVMYMHLFDVDTTNPPRDSSFSQDIVVHEYTHGLSNRLTGGPANSNCLSATESGGMGEGWSDFYAVANILVKTTDTRATNHIIGRWATGFPGGIRSHPYSTSFETNPLTYGSINDQEPLQHAIGTTWATMLYELLWNLIEKHGNTNAVLPTLDDSGVPTDGRFLAQKLVLDGMALQPCNPTFLQARDAIVDADRVLTNGANACDIWTAFAKRGLGANASRVAGVATNDFEIPTGVC